jgi:opacity protein-like surface antigen
MDLRACVGGVLFAAYLGLVAPSASAADLPVPFAPAPAAPVISAPAAIYSWTGFYIGADLAAGLAHSSWSDPFSGGRDKFNTGAGFLGGGEIGANFQWKMLVVGVEGDFDWPGSMAAATTRLAIRSALTRSGPRRSRAASALLSTAC